MGLRRVSAGAFAVLVMSFGVVGCSGDEQGAISPSDKTFAGLDPAVVREVVNFPAAQDRVAGDAEAVAAARYQGMVRNFVACRSALATYQAWLSSGVAPELPNQPTPTYPAATAEDMDNDIAAIKRDLASGDITLLRDRLTNPSGCGNWIPAEPGDAHGPTIADAVNGKL